MSAREAVKLFLICCGIMVLGIGGGFVLTISDRAYFAERRESHRRICYYGLRSQPSLADSVTYAAREDCGLYLPKP